MSAKQEEFVRNDEAEFVSFRWPWYESCNGTPMMRISLGLGVFGVCLVAVRIGLAQDAPPTDDAGVAVTAAPDGARGDHQSDARPPHGVSTAPQQTYKKPQKEWYGWQNLLVDGAAISLGIAGGLTVGGKAPAYVALGGYALGGPIVHLAHGRPAVSAGSLALRVGAPAVPILLGLALEPEPDPDCDDFDCSGGPAVFTGLLVGIGVLVGATTAMAVDAGALAWKEKPTPSVSVSVHPIVRYVSGKPYWGLAGTW